MPIKRNSQEKFVSGLDIVERLISSDNHDHFLFHGANSAGLFISSEPMNYCRILGRSDKEK